MPSEPHTCIAVRRLPGGVGSQCGYRRTGIAVLRDQLDMFFGLVLQAQRESVLAKELVRVW